MKQSKKTKQPEAAPARKQRSRPRVAKALADDVPEMVPRPPNIRRILVPIDFSKPSEKALRYAVSLARQFGSKITLLHVRPVPYYTGEFGYIPSPLPDDESSSAAIADRLVADARRLVPPGMLDRTVVRCGVAFDEICTAARELRTDLIIANTHGYTGLKHALLGSTAERVVRHAPCPVLVVREREREFA